MVVEREEWRAYSGDGVTDRVLARCSLRQLIFHTHTAHFVQRFYNYGNAALYTPSNRNLTDSAFITVHVLTSR